MFNAIKCAILQLTFVVFYCQLLRYLICGNGTLCRMALCRVVVCGVVWRYVALLLSGTENRGNSVREAVARQSRAETGALSVRDGLWCRALTWWGRGRSGARGKGGEAPGANLPPMEVGGVAIIAIFALSSKHSANGAGHHREMFLALAVRKCCRTMKPIIRI